MRKAAMYGTGVVILNLMANLPHTASHLGQHVVSLPTWQLAYVTLVIFIAPVAAAVLLWTRYREVRGWLLLASMVGSFVIGLAYHFLIPGPDNAFTLEPGAWQRAFWVSAVLLSLIEGAGSLVGVWILNQLARFPGAMQLTRPIGRIADRWLGPETKPRRGGTNLLPRPGSRSTSGTAHYSSRSLTGCSAASRTRRISCRRLT
jgi:hypothetical protein